MPVRVYNCVLWSYAPVRAQARELCGPWPPTFIEIGVPHGCLCACRACTGWHICVPYNAICVLKLHALIILSTGRYRPHAEVVQHERCASAVGNQWGTVLTSIANTIPTIGHGHSTGRQSKRGWGVFPCQKQNHKQTTTRTKPRQQLGSAPRLVPV